MYYFPSSTVQTHLQSWTSSTHHGPAPNCWGVGESRRICVPSASIELIPAVGRHEDMCGAPLCRTTRSLRVVAWYRATSYDPLYLPSQRRDRHAVGGREGDRLYTTKLARNWQQEAAILRATGWRWPFQVGRSGDPSIYIYIYRWSLLQGTRGFLRSLNVRIVME